MNVKTTIRGDNSQSSTVFVRLYNPNPRPAHARGIRCEFHKDQQLVKSVSVARLAVQPGEGEYQMPETVDVSFNRPICTLGR